MMTEQDFKAFKALMTRVSGVLGKAAPDDETAEFAFAVINNALPDVTIRELTRAAFAHLKESHFYPTPSHLIDQVQDDRDRNTPEYYRQFALPPRVETDEETKQAMQEALRRIRACASKVGKRMPTVDDPWEDAPWTDPRTPEQVAASRAEIAEQLASMTRRND